MEQMEQQEFDFSWKLVFVRCWEEHGKSVVF